MALAHGKKWNRKRISEIEPNKLDCVMVASQNRRENGAGAATKYREK